MSQNLRTEEHSEREMARGPEIRRQGNYTDSFEGVNYEQVRQPYNSRQPDRMQQLNERTSGERSDRG